MRILLIANAALILGSLALAQPPHRLNLMPMPSFVQPGVGQLPVDRSFSVAVTGIRDARLERGVVRFVAELSRQTGMFLQRPTNSANPTLLIRAVHGSEKAQKLSEDESYELVISPSGAKLTAPPVLWAFCMGFRPSFNWWKPPQTDLLCRW
jgi:hypothetical protein